MLKLTPHSAVCRILMHYMLVQCSVVQCIAMSGRVDQVSI